MEESISISSFDLTDNQTDSPDDSQPETSEGPIEKKPEEPEKDPQGKDDKKLGLFTSKAYVEDFIWGIRQRHEDLTREEMKAHVMIHPAKKRSVDPSVFIETRTKILASLVPDEIIENVDDYTQKYFSGCLLFGDVSGFTDLTERYNQEGKGGPSRLTLVLNSYIGALVQEIMAFGGDIFKFSGDAFLAIFKCKDQEGIMRDYIHKALDCALVIQKNYGTFQTDVGTYLRVKIAISAGPLIFSLIGNERYSHYILVGKPIMDVKEAESLSSAGEIVIAPSAWYHVNTTDYISIEIDGLFRKVVGLGTAWRHIKTDNKFSVASRTTMNRNTNEPVVNPFVETNPIIEELQEDLSALEMTPEQIKNYLLKRNMEFALRPIIHQADHVKESLRKFILAPVMHCIDSGEPIEYLTEMRRVVIMFINMTSKRCSYNGVIALVNDCYIEICKFAEQFMGCVNKVSLFDKDIMFVVIFGLRGFKHDLDCQYALRCASLLFDVLNNHKGLKTVSIACTTGKTYCGIVGHTLRREYTVMSLSVNKAARIMVNYPDRIACDSATFHHSKLAAKNFILQVFKPMKGITNPGPIYEFQLVPDRETLVVGERLPLSKYPILGREVEIKQFLLHMEIFLKNCDRVLEKLSTFIRMLLIKGWPRQGKSRLLQEMVNLVEKPIRMVHLSLSEKSINKKFFVIKTLLYVFMGIDSTSNKKDLKRLLKLLSGNRYRSYLCCFNRVFKTDFEETEVYLKKSEEFRNVVLCRLIKHVCYACLPGPCLVTIEKAKFIDEDSWRFMYGILACRYIFSVLTIDQHYIPTPEADKIFKHPVVKLVQLNDIARIYHSGLACQILNVYAISADLEHLLNKKSNGNPGWVEALLITLKQSHTIFMKNADYKTINDYGLVAPPLYMLQRMTPENILRWKQLVEGKKMRFQTIIDRWHFYVDTCRENMESINLREKIHRLCLKERNIPVCFMHPRCDFNNIDYELSKEGRLVMTFDSLTYQEQLLLKCSSVLGDSFARSLLMFVMHSTDTYRQVSGVIKSLFEKRVLCCAKGDFSEGGNYLLLRHRMNDPSVNLDIDCSCLGIYTTDDVRDLPKYATCGYLRFVSSAFRETTYNLLIDAQKKSFHLRAAKYLLKETKRCTSCGGEAFDLAAYCKLDDLKIRLPELKPLIYHDSDQLSSIYASLQAKIADTKSDQSSSASYTSKKSNILGTEAFKSLGASIGTSLFRVLLPSFDDEDEGSFYAHNVGRVNPLDMIKFKDNYSLVKQFTRIDFQSCHCHLILTYLYNQLIYHHRGAGQWMSMLHAMLRYIAICLDYKNLPEAIKYINDGLKFLATSSDSLGVPRWKSQVLLGKFIAWRGEILLILDQKKEALKLFLKAVSKFGYPFPREFITLNIKLLVEKLMQKIYIYFNPDKYADLVLSEADNEIADGVSWVMNKLFHMFVEKRKMKKAEYCAVSGLTKALEADVDIFQASHSFANLILIASYHKQKLWSTVLEVHGLRFCHRKRNGLDPPELRAVVRLYFVVFETWLSRAEYDDALHIGYILVRLSTASNLPVLAIKTFSKIILVLVVKLYLAECITILEELSNRMADDETPEAKGEFYASALLFQLETGYNFVAFRDIETYYHTECTLAPGPEQRKFLILLRTWYSRVHEWESAKMVDDLIPFVPVCLDSCEMVLHLAYNLQNLYELEYTLMQLVNMINKRNVNQLQRCLNKIKNLFKSLESHMEHLPLIKPRLWLMRAYEAVIWNDEPRMFKCLFVARKWAVEHENILQYRLSEFLEMYWMDELPIDEAFSWLRHCEPEHYVEYNQLDHEDYIMCYPFPAPLFK